MYRARWREGGVYSPTRFDYSFNILIFWPAPWNLVLVYARLGYVPLRALTAHSIY